MTVVMRECEKEFADGKRGYGKKFNDTSQIVNKVSQTEKHQERKIIEETKVYI